MNRSSTATRKVGFWSGRLPGGPRPPEHDSRCKQLEMNRSSTATRKVGFRSGRLPGGPRPPEHYSKGANSSRTSCSVTNRIARARAEASPSNSSSTKPIQTRAVL